MRKALLTAVVAFEQLAAPATLACPADPNVVFVVDTSGSMATIVEHPGFDPSAPTVCNAYTATVLVAHDTTQTRCGTTRTYHVDSALEARGIPTRFHAAYLNWLHDLPDGHPYLGEIDALDSGVLPACLGGGSYAAYRESRLSAAVRFVADVVCRATALASPRLGLARMRTGADPAGGYVVEPVGYDVLGLEAALAALTPEDSSPLGETLFDIYTYAMSRTLTDRPVGVDGFTRFPPYVWNASGDQSAFPLESPVQQACQENLAVIVADDAPTRDDFDADLPDGNFFSDFQNLIGNYNPDDAYPEAGNEEPGSSPTCTSSCEVALYLDDIALFMRERDFRPDLPGVQRFRTYVVGFGHDAFARALFEKAADVGGGAFLLPQDAGYLAGQILDAGQQPVAVPALGGGGAAMAALVLAATCWIAAARGDRSSSLQPEQRP